MKPNRAAFNRVYKELDNGAAFNLNMVGDVFGKPFYELIILCFLDATDAARAIQGSINRLRMGEQADDTDDSLDDIEADGDKEPN